MVDQTIFTIPDEEADFPSDPYPFLVKSNSYKLKAAKHRRLNSNQDYPQIVHRKVCDIQKKEEAKKIKFGPDNKK